MPAIEHVEQAIKEVESEIAHTEIKLRELKATRKDLVDIAEGLGGKHDRDSSGLRKTKQDRGFMSTSKKQTLVGLIQSGITDITQLSDNPLIWTTERLVVGTWKKLWQAGDVDKPPPDNSLASQLDSSEVHTKEPSLVRSLHEAFLNKFDRKRYGITQEQAEAIMNMANAGITISSMVSSPQIAVDTFKVRAVCECLYEDGLIDSPNPGL